MREDKKRPAGVDAPSEGKTNKNQINYSTHRPWRASADTRCWNCDWFKENKCNGLIDYHFRDCLKYIVNTGNRY